MSGTPVQRPGQAQTGTTPGWFKRRTVTFFYHTNNFFCRTPVEDGKPVGSTSACEVGSDDIIDTIQGNWWELKVIGVKDLATWNQVVAGKSLATVRALQAADPTQTHITSDTFTNLYLFFEVHK